MSFEDVLAQLGLDRSHRGLLDPVEGEQECCSFATWLFSEDEGRLVLRVTAEPEAIAAVAAMFGGPE